MSDRAKVTAVVLAGGLGTRLRSVVSDRPKVLADVCGRPFITYLLDVLSHSCISEVVLATGYLAEQIESLLGSSYKGMTLHYSREVERKGTGGAVRLGLPKVSHELVLVMNGDSFCEIDMGRFIESHQASEFDVSMAVRQVEDTARYGRVELSSENRVLAFEEKLAGRFGAGWINAGIYLFPRRALEEIPSTGEVSMEREVLPGLLASGVGAFQCGGRFIDIGLPETLTEAQTFFADMQ